MTMEGNNDLDAILFGNFNEADEAPAAQSPSTFFDTIEPAAIDSFPPPKNKNVPENISETHTPDLTPSEGPKMSAGEQEPSSVPETATGSPSPATNSDVIASPNLRSVKFEIPLPSLAPEKRAEYFEPHSDTVDFVVAEVFDASSDYPLLRVEFTDATQETLPLDELVQYSGGESAYEVFEKNRATNMAAARAKKRRHSDFASSETESTDDVLADLDDEIAAVRSKHTKRLRIHTTRSRGPTHYSSDDDEVLFTKPPRARQLRERLPRKATTTGTVKATSYADDDDELAQDPIAQLDEDDGTFMLVTSDINPKPGRGRPRLRTLNKRASQGGAGSRGSSIEFEDDSRRRSGRSTRNQKLMLDDALMDDESFYIEDTRAPGAPKVISVKEVFKPLPPDSDFPTFHEDACRICTLGPVSHKGLLIGCQGCSFSFHKVCIGYRAQREHQSTKVGVEDFVLQCKWCIGGYRKKEPTAPHYSACQDCKKDGPSCAGFSEKMTSRQEEKLRQENGGEDPITPVDAKLINNPANVMFRCAACKRAWHYEHLPSSRMQSDVSETREQRLAEYSVDWKCEDCGTKADKPQTLVAWRPTNDKTENPLLADVGFDDKEYLVKWQDKSYHHCTWMPGAWIFGVTPGAMQKAFAKRDALESLLKRTTKEAVPEEYLLIDVILQVKGEKATNTSKAADMGRIGQIKQVYVKFQGLGYEDVVWDSPPKSDSGPLYDAFEAAYKEYLNGKYFASEPSSKMRERLRKYKKEGFVDPMGQPKGIKRGKLMEYQLEGVAWMLYNFHQERNIILADEMGLGKTVQIVSLIAQLALDEPHVYPFVVVVPNSTCPNWRREIKFWAPDLRVVTYHGGKRSQEIAYKYELFPNGSKDMKAHVVVMSYDSAQDDRTRALFKSVQWAGLVVDEGQRLKNDQNLLYAALQAMRVPFRLLLTGTPLQNNKRELFNLLQFVDPSHNAAKLDEEYSELNAENLPKLHEKIRPYFLRRTKAAVLKFLPPMAQIILPVSMSVLQAKLCKSIMAKSPELLKAIFADDKLRAKDRGNLNNILVQLRKCLCHPFMYSEAIEEKGLDFTQSHANLVSASSKLVLLQQMLPKLKERGHRVLLFSQFLNQLDIIEDFLNGLGFDYRRLDGSISSLEKQRRIDAYNAPDSPVFAFLLSTRAGGVGINLATADTVIILDPDFNPHQDIQALSRAHRIGQKNKVLCFQLVTKNSAEEKIMQIGRKKMALDHVLIESMDNEDEAPDDLESILKYGASALFGEGEADIIRYDDASIDKLLDRSEIEQTKTDDDGATNFSFARVWANDKGTLDADLAEHEDPTLHPSVWDNILKEREAEALRLAEQEKIVLGRGGRRRQAINYRTNQTVEARDSASEEDADFKESGDDDDDDDEDDDMGDAAGYSEPSTSIATSKRQPNPPAGPNTQKPPVTKAGSGRSTPLSKQAKSSTPQEKSIVKSVKKGRPPTLHKLPTKPAPAPTPTAPAQGTGIPQWRQSQAFTAAYPPTAPSRSDHPGIESYPPHLRSLYQALGRGEIRAEQFDTLARQVTDQFAANRNATAQAAPVIFRGPLANSAAGVTNGLPDRGLGQKPRAAVEVVIPVSSNAAATQEGRCPLCKGFHRPSTCAKLQKERHVRLALDGLGQWSSNREELAAERKALRDKLKVLC
ncbi:chromo domain-containing protein [Plectosphaerella plurivora]|uniref:Chromo domain-containing protein n=1 Tax=Plectosphaerella plurivora TaxID=936078 RepID=A0A9P9AIP5_9PEZI|nr:chromo domain-containing protein [Plectosphaerella plurivora]